MLNYLLQNTLTQDSVFENFDEILTSGFKITMFMNGNLPENDAKWDETFVLLTENFKSTFQLAKKVSSQVIDNSYNLEQNSNSNKS